MSEILLRELPEPYYSGNIRSGTGSDNQEKPRPKTVPASIGAIRNDITVPFRPASGCRRLNEYVQDGGTPKGGVYRLPTSHKPHKMKLHRPQSPLEVVSEQSNSGVGVRLMKSKSSFVAEVAYGNANIKQVPPSSEGKKGSIQALADIDDDDSLLLKMKDAELAIKDKVMQQLQQQLDDFQLQLGEERLNHQDTKKEYENRLNNLRITKDAEREASIRNLTSRYEKEINDNKIAHEELVADLKNDHSRIKKTLEDRVEHLENAFDEFRISFTSEMELKWKKREDEMRKKIQDEADTKASGLVVKIQESHSDEIAKMKKKHAEEMEVIKHEHETEVNSLLRKYKDAYSLSEKVARQQQLIEGLHERLREFEGKLEDTTHLLADKTREAAELTMKLTAMERDFANKLQQNADAWQRRLESYITENADIKRLYAFSVHRLSCDRLERDIEMRDRARNAAQLANARLAHREQLMEAVLHSRIRTGLPLIPSNPPTEEEERRIRQAQLLRRRAAKLGARAAINASGDAISPKDGTSHADAFVANAGRPLSAPTTDIENFCVFMAAAAALNTTDDENNNAKSHLPVIFKQK